MTRVTHKKDNVIYLDLDNTLIDSKGRTEQELLIAQKYGLTAEDLAVARNTVFERHGISKFGYQVLYEACCEVRPGLPDAMLAEWWEILRANVFFPDSTFFLEQFAKEELTLLTTGNPDFQQAKIAAHGLAQLVGHITIVPSPKSAHIDTPPEISFYVDDSPRELDAMKLRYPHVICIQAREPAPWEHQKVSLHKDVHCATLENVFAFIVGRMP